MRELTAEEITKIETSLIDGDFNHYDPPTIKFIDGKIEFVVTNAEDSAREAIRIMRLAGLNIRNDDDVSTMDAYWIGPEGGGRQKVFFVIADVFAPLFLGDHNEEE